MAQNAALALRIIYLAYADAASENPATPIQSERIHMV